MEDQMACHEMEDQMACHGMEDHMACHGMEDQLVHHEGRFSIYSSLQYIIVTSHTVHRKRRTVNVQGEQDKSVTF